MPWHGHNATVCKRCGRHVDECGPLSNRYRCADCGDGEMLRNVAELRAHRGPRFLRWRRGVVAGVGGVLPEDLAAAELDSTAS